MTILYNDRREAILLRLAELLANIGPVNLLGGPNGPNVIAPGNFVHNRNELPQELVPGVILLDADEVRDLKQAQPPPGNIQTRGIPDAIYKMTPEIYVVLDVRKPQNLHVGPDLNIARLAILGAIFTDSTLMQIVGANGNIVYDGCVTDLARNRTMQGQLGMSITFSYPLKRGEIVATGVAPVVPSP